MHKSSFALLAVATVLIAVAVSVFAVNTGRPASAALGGPVILGGDDLTDHGSVSGGTTLIDGWLYIRKALENLKPNVLRPGNDNSVAVLGSADSAVTSSNAGAAYHYAAPQAGLGVSFHDGDAAINKFFADLASGAVNPAIIVTAGTGASNDLDASEGAALTANAASIANFVNSGGGLLSHGADPTVSYGWLFALLPAATAPGGCSIPLTLTAAGQAAFPGLTNDNVSSGPCHNNFTGDLGGLQILATDTQGRNAIIGGGNVKLPGSIDLSPSSATNIVGTSHTVTATVLDGQPPSPAVGAKVTFAITAGPNAGASGTCTPKADCTTDTKGQVSFSYTSNGTAGTDTIAASFVTQREVTESTLATKIWELPPASPAISLSPATDTNPVGTNHTVTATVTDGGVAQADVDVAFEVTKGPNTGDKATATTDANGKASFTYKGDGGDGTDTIEACFTPPVESTPTPEPTATPQPTPSPTPGPLQFSLQGEPTPTPTPTATPEPTPAPAPPPDDVCGTVTKTWKAVVAAAVQLPTTGGEPAGGSHAFTWLAVIAGAIVMTTGGGLWFAYQRRRVR